MVTQLRLYLDHYPILNITYYDLLLSILIKKIYIQLEKLCNREIMYELDIGKYKITT